MIEGLSGATIWSQDLRNLLPFYRRRAGPPVGIQNPGFVVFRQPRRAVRASHWARRAVRGRNADPARHMVGLTTDDVRADSNAPERCRGREFIGGPDRLMASTASRP